MKKAPAALTGGGLILQQGQQPDDAQQLGSLLHLFAAVLPAEGLQSHQKLGLAVRGRKGGHYLGDAAQPGGIEAGGLGTAACAAQHPQKGGEIRGGGGFPGRFLRRGRRPVAQAQTGGKLSLR